MQAMNTPQFTPLEQYALLSNRAGSALTTREGTMAWLCLPRFDSPATFAAILGREEHGHWTIRVRDAHVASWEYLPGSMTVQTIWECPTGVAVVRETMPPAEHHVEVLRTVQCTHGTVIIEHAFHPVADYGRWPLRPEVDGTLYLSSLIEGAESTRRQNAWGETVRLSQGETCTWGLSTHFPAEEPDVKGDFQRAWDAAHRLWDTTSRRSRHLNAGDPATVLHERSLLVLQALTHKETGGMVAGATASLPELFGGGRNWDYRYTWLRDSAFATEVLAYHGYLDIAQAWVEWLHHALDELPDNLLIMYGVGGEKELPERVIDFLPGYENSAPVRVGNGAVDQYQADVVGEVMLALGQLRRCGLHPDERTWRLQRNLVQFVLNNLNRRDHGIWEMRGNLHFFTHGRVMMWAALNEAIATAEECGLDGDLELWREHRDSLKAEIMAKGVDPATGAFTQTYGGTEVDASLLQIPMTGFCTPDDPTMLATVARIEEDLVDELGYLYRYRTSAGLDGLEGSEYPFMICAFWLVEQYAQMPGRLSDAKALMSRLEAAASPLGLLAEEYDPATRRLAGNFPQAFSHLGYIRAYDTIARVEAGSIGGLGS